MGREAVASVRDRFVEESLAAIQRDNGASRFDAGTYSSEEGAESGLAAGERLRRLREVKALLATEEGISYPQPMLVPQILHNCRTAELRTS